MKAKVKSLKILNACLTMKYQGMLLIYVVFLQFRSQFQPDLVALIVNYCFLNYIFSLAYDRMHHYGAAPDWRATLGLIFRFFQAQGKRICISAADPNGMIALVV